MKRAFTLTCLVPALLLVLTACGGGDEKKTPADTTPAQDIVDGDNLVGEDLSIDDTVVPPEDVPTVDETEPPASCEPACDFGAGEYCDQTDMTCKAVACTYCYKNKDCSEGETCSQFEFANGDWGSFCAKSCTADADCAADQACKGDPKICVPKAACAVDSCGEGAPGDPCAYEDVVNMACGACQENLTCYGIVKSEQAPCENVKDCLMSGFPAVLNPECTGGFCSASYCVGKCVDFACEAGFEPVSAGLGKCVCIPSEVGTGDAGDPCPIWNVHFEADYCGDGLTCLGIPAEAVEEDPEANTCDTVADCDPANWFLNPDCVDGYCGTSFCAPMCDENDDCAAGFYPISVGDDCFCAPTEVGESKAGEACPIFGVNPEADACLPGLNCLGIAPDADTDECQTAADCDADNYPGGTVCVDGHCGTSFCSPKCDAMAECEEGFAPIGVGDKCYCQPAQTGDGMPGDACPFGVTNGDADLCDGSLNCFGINAEETVPCTEDSDCANPPYAGNAQCVDGWCGTSFCSPKCDEGACDDGWEPLTYENFGIEKCNCVPSVPEGDAVAGDACPLYNVNADAGYCAQGLSCIGDIAIEGAPTCDNAEDCAAESLLGPPVCTQGYCASTTCIADCATDGDLCDAGAPYFYGDCFCNEDFETGDAKAGEACPYATVNTEAANCMDTLVCAGVGIGTDSDACETAADCAAADYPGVIDCVDGFCGSSLCLAQCTDGECGDGFETIETDAGLCFCLPVTE